MDFFENEHGTDNWYGENAAECSGGYEERKPKKTRMGLKITALVLCCTLLGGAAGYGGACLRAGRADDAEENPITVYEGKRETKPLEIVQVDTAREMSPAEVYAANVNSTVGIKTSITTNFWGYQTTSAASGSGFILSSDGYIITNYHVIESSSSVTVTLYSSEEYEAQIIGFDPSNDVAVLKIEAEGLSPVVLGDSSSLNVGDNVVAIGNPLGELTFSLTGGYVSALDREVTMSGGVTMDLIQTDCAINSGNSGGALFNMYGEVIGITNAKYSGSGSGASIDNIGFAIPINSVRDIVDSIVRTGMIVKPYIGVSVATVSQEALSYGLPAGASVQKIDEGSPAEKAGLQINDIITAVGDTEISSSGDLVDCIGDCAPNDVLTVHIYRQGETLELTLTVGEQSRSALSETSQQSTQQNNSQTMPYGFGFPWSFFG